MHFKFSNKLLADNIFAHKMEKNFYAKKLGMAVPIDEEGSLLDLHCMKARRGWHRATAGG